MPPSLADRAGASSSMRSTLWRDGCTDAGGSTAVVISDILFLRSPPPKKSPRPPRAPCRGASCCYVLVAPGTGRTYCGVTNALDRRLRQHNGLRSGGARYTRSGGPWVPACTVEGFMSRALALAFEWWVKRRTTRGGLAARCDALADVLLEATGRWWRRRATADPRGTLVVRAWPALGPPHRRAALGARLCAAGVGWVDEPPPHSAASPSAVDAASSSAVDAASSSAVDAASSSVVDASSPPSSSSSPSVPSASS